jgi:hypothetical protein
MTVVISDGTFMVSDSLLTDGDVVTETQKIFTSPKAIIGIAGDVASCLRFVYWYNDRRRKPPGDDEDFNALVWTPDGGLVEYNGYDEAVPITNTWAIGSGASVAMGAAYALQSKENEFCFDIDPLTDAVKVAIDIANGCGGEIQAEALHNSNLRWNFKLPKSLTRRRK